MSDEQPTDTPAAGELRVDSVGIHSIGQRLIDLGKLLVTTGGYTENEALRHDLEEADRFAGSPEADVVEREARAAIRQTLTGLNTFRREYSDWERLTVEYALTRQGFTQREVATLLGVGLSTVNRWAQHPLAYDED